MLNGKIKAVEGRTGVMYQQLFAVNKGNHTHTHTKKKKKKSVWTASVPAKI
jgi:hypothetical protein